MSRVVYQGGKEHGVPILISHVHPGLPADTSHNLYVGDALLSANGINLRNASQRDAVQILSQQVHHCMIVGVKRVMFSAIVSTTRVNEWPGTCGALQTGDIELEVVFVAPDEGSEPELEDDNGFR